jgi:hypothetical protein
VFTPIHRVLGEAPGPLTWQMIEQLVEQQVEEAADLDFKQILPNGKGEWRDETAKDLAAMANSGGGVVVYGVAEQRGRGTAKSIERVELKESDVRSLTQVAYNLVHPPLMDIRPVKIVDPQRPELGVLAIVVPPSAEVPHMYWRREAFLAPVRHGADTQWMDERQIEHAYRERFEGRRRRQADLEEFYNETQAQVMPHSNLCFVAVASPAGIGGMDSYPADAEDAIEIFYEATRGSKEFIRSEDSIFTRFSLSPSIGLRRWRWLHSNPADHSQYLVELHRDGSVALIVDINGWFLGEDRTGFAPETSSLAVEFALAGFGALLSAVGQRLRNDGGYEVRAGLTWRMGSEGKHPMDMYLSYDRREHMSRPEPVRRFAPVEGLLRAQRAEELRADLYLLCTDMLNQAGLNQINFLRAN